ncbi:acyltransferase family protein [Gracilibacillus salinarum]|uniref:Acyltransferase n=1 Tax=Gracilibacillus salinarum TaxID=2932255 RepID=A0ABY4GRR2_9BACI|nr:acyltransferase family protein [Gracilibacillus salinarum]UOQ86820.1 acyltransferase [Gracilibacillus salinarum]
MSDLRIMEKRFRPELEGIRVVAAMLVAIYHIWIGSVSGGVDVFFIVSGYLITLSLLTKLERRGRVNYFEYILGLMKRLFPLVFVVLFFTTIFSFFIMPHVQYKQIISEIIASGLYFENWLLAHNAVDYLAQNNEASPLQHFWALSLQGQFYITWPLIIFFAYLLAKKVWKTPIRKTLLGVLITIFILSLCYSVYITKVNQPWAYFNTFARAWEFSLGGILALLLPYLKCNTYVSTCIGWIGLAIISFTGLLLPVSNVFPGYVALLPTAGVILVIVSAENNSIFGVARLLGSKFFQFFGSISYGFYLWHWPLLILYFNYTNSNQISFLHGLFIMLLAFGSSFLSIQLVEKPIRRMDVKGSKSKLYKVLPALMIPVFLLNVMWWVYSSTQTTQTVSAEEYTIEKYPGARAFSENITPDEDVDPIAIEPGNTTVLPAFYAEKDCYSDLEENVVSYCSYGVTDNPDYTIALVGGSHSGHWFPPLAEIAQNLNIQIDLYNKDGCRFTADDFDGAMSDTCMKWNEEVIEPLKDNPPDLLFTTANVNSGSTIPEGYLKQWEKFESVTTIFAIRDNPRMKEKIPLCLEEKSIEECSVPRKDVLSDSIPWENTDNIPGNVYFADLSDQFCDDDTCYPVIGNVVVYKDQHHITALYAKSMTNVLETYIREALGGK